MSKFSNWLRPKQAAKHDAAEKSDELLDEKIQETRDATNRMVRQSRKEAKKSQEVLEIAEEALRTIKSVV